MKNMPGKLLSLCLLLMAGNTCLRVGPAAASEDRFRPEEWTAVSDEQLSDTRGGFDTDSGLTVSFGIIRSVMVNGDLVTQTSFNLPDVTRISSEQATLASAALSESGLIQIGTGNNIEAIISAQLASSTVIQNSLNNQNIQTLTVINTGVNSLSLLKDINTQSVLNDALLGAMGSR
ncbi:MAG: hypothetical protein KJ614_03965 [Gammaproteobacteria bacterium]|uniref:hypothetical protein n=1 Tax=Rhodoferax sp. TaxID=50421 RepID=UPI0017A167B9|nr:hypothetical protein [Rhodoferax sp.]MBU3898075.1 hypothetical protein [Gammaproteobacteria bacterium]MBA3056391.1 hypothetical protein [Rhodoferax sp.]MBU3999168.1 hypothetical protein [Gammaproteobacteria bacterium]MBU4081731.1 hypothetical protein [Gammaproteobacteria bacterium]MBU4114613.1 hypothetical protein [Gammaproteobacteria bacterium]